MPNPINQLMLAFNSGLEWLLTARVPAYYGFRLLSGINAALTAALACRKEVLLEVGGFNMNFLVAAGEDADLKLRICQRGHWLLYIPHRMLHLQDYSWVRLRRQCYVRGVGRNYYEYLHGAGYLGRLKIALCFVRRVLDLPFDLFKLPHPLPLVKLADGLVTCYGQWQSK